MPEAAVDDEVRPGGEEPGGLHLQGHLTAEPAWVAPVLADLHLDDVLAQHGSTEAAVEAAFRRPVRSAPVVRLRQAVAKDLDGDGLGTAARQFRSAMQQVRGALRIAADTAYPRAGRLWLLEAASRQRQAKDDLRDVLVSDAVSSPALRLLRDHLRSPQSSDQAAADAELDAVHRGVAELRYRLDIRNSRIEVSRLGDEPDQDAEVAALFARFQQTEPRAYLSPALSRSGMNHATAAILDHLADLEPDVFHRVDEYLDRHPVRVEPALARFDADAAFYLTYLDLIEPLRTAGLPFCYPDIVPPGTGTALHDAFDLSLALRREDPRPIVLNDFILPARERIAVITGPNSGGKTTYARGIAQAHYLTTLGLPVPGRAAQIPLVDQIVTVFERAEHPGISSGQLVEELQAIRQLLDTATPATLVVLNEAFTSTSMRAAGGLGAEVLHRITTLGAACVCVTFLDELAAGDRSMVSLVSADDPAHPDTRTYRFRPGPPTGLAMARAQAARYRLTYDDIRRRVRGARAVDAPGG